MAYRHIEVKPLAGACGAELFGADLARPLDDEVVAEIRRAFLDHLIVVFRDQTLTPEEHVALARRFGTPERHPMVRAVEGHPEIIAVTKLEHETANFGGIWHYDLTFQAKPAIGSLLYALETPSHGGDTLFANQYLAYETLSDGLKTVLEDLDTVHTNRAWAPREAYGAHRSIKLYQDDWQELEAVHPAVTAHHETGRKALFVNSNSSMRFAGWTEEESRPLLAHLAHHATRPEFTCRVRWQPGTLVFWDNRCAMHYAINDYHGRRRVLHRVSIGGERMPSRIAQPLHEGKAA
ncbi:MAG: TauD/TfdA family dioxygenase [Proteobacteria bacterium]|nr:TauD/TfdA family dioxygenase [Pseudomonadota bacterium]